MIFESLWPLAFLLAVPVVVILYLLVPKGTDTPVSSNLLWKKLFYNEQSKTFWEKFLHNLLMYLQIVILLLLILALMAPFVQRKGTGSTDVVYLIDLLEFKAEPTIVKKLETGYRRDEKVIRYITVKLDKYAVEYAEKRRNKLAKKEEA